MRQNLNVRNPHQRLARLFSDHNWFAGRKRMHVYSQITNIRTGVAKLNDGSLQRFSAKIYLLVSTHLMAVKWSDLTAAIRSLQPRGILKSADQTKSYRNALSLTILFTYGYEAGCDLLTFLFMVEGGTGARVVKLFRRSLNNENNALAF
jgi:hypothetical protein